MRVVWLASYPKSGNTWLRLLLANLSAEGAVDINAMPGDRIASARGRFDEATLIPSGLLTHEECDAVRPALYRQLASDRGQDDSDAAPFAKTHDAWTVTRRGEPLLGGAAAARAAVLVVRDPRDVALSLANHHGRSIDATIAFMGRPDSAFCGGRDRQSRQLRQQLLDWSGFQASWLGQRALPLHLVRYEDLHADPISALAAVARVAGLDPTDAALARAAERSGFDALRRQEEQHGFREAPPRRTGRFFRRGRAGGWRDELTPAQAERIEADHRPMMRRLGYLGAGA